MRAQYAQRASAPECQSRGEQWRRNYTNDSQREREMEREREREMKRERGREREMERERMRERIRERMGEGQNDRVRVNTTGTGSQLLLFWANAYSVRLK